MDRCHAAPHHLLMAFRTFLKHWRKQRGLTQEALAHAIGLSGQSGIANYETGVNEPSLEMLARLADALAVPVGALVNEAEFRAFQAQKPASDPLLQQVIHDFMVADTSGRYVVAAAARAASESKLQKAS